MNLDVVANDMFIDDVEELKEYVNFANDENVKNKNFELIEEKTTFPDIQGGDGFYWAKLKKND